MGEICPIDDRKSLIFDTVNTDGLALIGHDKVYLCGIGGNAADEDKHVSDRIDAASMELPFSAGEQDGVGEGISLDDVHLAIHEAEADLIAPG